MQLFWGGGELRSSSFSLDKSGFQEEVALWVCMGLVKAFEMSQVDVKQFTALNFCATPSVLRGNKTSREQSPWHERRKAGDK